MVDLVSHSSLTMVVVLMHGWRRTVSYLPGFIVVDFSLLVVVEEEEEEN